MKTAEIRDKPRMLSKNDRPFRAWYTLTSKEVAELLGSSLKEGLSEEEAARRLLEKGPNELPKAEIRTPFEVFLGQFSDLMIWILLAAALISGLLLGEYIDAAAITAILLINAVLGTIQELRAQAAIESLKKMTSPRAGVIRNGRESILPASEIVPGDIVVLEAGDVVPADCRLIEAVTLQVDESSLTGESVAAYKSSAWISAERLAIGDRKNLLFLGSTVQVGRARAIVVETGSDTEMGKIAGLASEPSDPTPLQVELKKVGRSIALIVVAIAFIVFSIGIATGKPTVLMFLAATSLAVAAIPEGLPAIVTVTLSLGVRAMASSNAIIRRLHAVETLGATTFIATDKTGTLTKNTMVVKFLGDRGDLTDVSRLTGITSPSQIELIEAAVLANDARAGVDGFIGDPTEIALLALGEQVNISKEERDRRFPRLDEIPFDSSRKMMTTLHKNGDSFVAYAKGAPEVILERCRLSDNERASVRMRIEKLANEGFRTLLFAKRRFNERPVRLTDEEHDFEYLGLMALLDPPREEVAEALDICRKAGVRVAMVTGDHASTAAAIARNIGLVEKETAPEVITGRELETISSAELRTALNRVSVFARVDPSHKLKIVQALKAEHEVVAMTGDGVNDAPALKKADIGVAMGIAGTEVAKEASDMVLADDNFATIVTAIKEGRIIFGNLKKFIHFLLSCNVSEVLTMFLVTLAGLPIPLFPVQLLWINLITDGFPALALGVDPPSEDLMARPPRRSEEGIVAPKALRRLLSWGALLTTGTVGSYLAVLAIHGVPVIESSDILYAREFALARTTTFTTMVFQQLVHSLNFRSETKTLFSPVSVKNRLLLMAIGGSVLIQIMTIYLPGANLIFKTTPLGVPEWLVVATAVAIPVILIDWVKRLKWSK